MSAPSLALGTQERRPNILVIRRSRAWLRRHTSTQNTSKQHTSSKSVRL